MSKKPDTASALAGILKAKRGDDVPAAVAPPVAVRPAPETTLPPPLPCRLLPLFRLKISPWLEGNPLRARVPTK